MRRRPVRLPSDTVGMAPDAQEPLAELQLARHRDLLGRGHEHWGQRIVTAVLVFVVGYAFFLRNSRDFGEVL